MILYNQPFSLDACDWSSHGEEEPEISSLYFVFLYLNLSWKLKMLFSIHWFL